MHRVDSRATVISVPDREVETVIRYGTWEALLRGTDVELIHVLRPEEDLRDAEDLVDEAAKAAEVLVGPGILVGGRVISGTQVASVLTAVADASVVVVRERDSLYLQRAICEQSSGDGSPPVVCVPTRWDLTPDDTRPVLVAVGDLSHARALLSQAMELALMHETRLHVVHTWSVPAAQGWHLDPRVGDQWTRVVTRDLEKAMAFLPRGHLGLVDIDVVHGPPAEVVVGAAEDAQLLVLERNAPSADAGAHLGRIARAALHACPCPVLLLPPMTELPAAVTGAGDSG